MVTICAAVTGLTAAATAQQMPRQDGLWKVQVQMEMPGMPMQLPPISMEQCVTPEDVKDPMRAVPPSGPAGNPNSPDCKMVDYQTVGNKVTWKMECTGSQKMTGVGEMVYTDDTYAGSMTMTTDGKTMMMKLNGVRLGDCSK
jgi:hypothetical protein